MLGALSLPMVGRNNQERKQTMKKEITITVEPVASAAGEHDYRITKMVNEVIIPFNSDYFRIGDVANERVIEALNRRPFYKVIVTPSSRK
jgi:hypothetical protein